MAAKNQITFWREKAQEDRASDTSSEYTTAVQELSTLTGRNLTKGRLNEYETGKVGVTPPISRAINSLIIKDVLEKEGVPTENLSQKNLQNIADYLSPPLKQKKGE